MSLSENCRSSCEHENIGALDGGGGGVPMSHVKLINGNVPCH